MPQFDNFSFFSQIFWTLLFFLLFYLVLNYYLLPAIAISLKVRKRFITIENSVSTIEDTTMKSALIKLESFFSKSYFVNNKDFFASKLTNLKSKETSNLSIIFIKGKATNFLKANFSKTIIDIL